MNAVGTWLDSLYGTDEYFWVAVKDIDTDNKFWWITDEEILIPENSSFWLPGEPNHVNGDCGCLQVKSEIGLKLPGSCNDGLYALCKL